MKNFRQYCHNLYQRILDKSGTPTAHRLMMTYSALESIIIPIPVDPLLVATVLARPKKWIRLTVGCTIASVIGGCVGWGLGGVLGLGVDEVLAFMPDAIAGPRRFAAVRDGFENFGIAIVFIGAFTPLPYKVIAISSGLLGFALLPFVAVSLVGRGLRFGVVAAIARYHGDARIAMALVGAFVLMVAGAYWMVK